jgi:hypothetical protein
MCLQSILDLCTAFPHACCLQPSAKPPYRDLGVMQELAAMMRTATQAAARAPLVADDTKKWLQWDEFLGFVQALRAECAGGLMHSVQPKAL